MSMFGEILNNKTVLAIGAHPDDIELGCGGTLLKMVSEGWKVYTVICSSGSIKTLSSLRISEYRSACKYLGVKKAHRLNYQDGCIKHDSNLVRDLDKIISEVNPSVVFSQSIVDHHQDHIGVSLSSISACRRLPINLILYPNLSSIRQSEFNFFVDISSYMDAKLKLLAYYKSQSESSYLKPNFVERNAMFAGDIIGKKYVEKFLIYSYFD